MSFYRNKCKLRAGLEFLYKTSEVGYFFHTLIGKITSIFSLQVSYTWKVSLEFYNCYHEKSFH